MAKKNKQKYASQSEANQIGKSVVKPTAQTISASETNSKSKLSWMLMGFIAIFTFILYSNTFTHRFVLDDHGIIKNNKITKAPVSWENTKLMFSTPLRKGDFSDLENSLYRPFVKILFNVEWNLFHGNEDVVKAAHKFHIVNVLLYALLCSLIFLVLYEALHRKWIIPFLATLLFAVHPMHVEVVANVKSGDEILSLLGIVLAIRCIQIYISKSDIKYLVLATLSFLMASFSKESTVVAVALIPLFIYFFTKANLKQGIIVSSIMLASSLFFLFCRWSVLHVYPKAAEESPLDNFMILCKNDPSTSQFASAVSTLGLYIKTFFYPYPLSCDYSYSSLLPVGFGDPGFILSFLFFVGIFVFAILKFKSKNSISFGILWFFAAMSITSNVFFLIGTSFGERLFFVPSLGLCFALVALLAHYLLKNDDDKQQGVFATISKSPILFGILFLMIGAYSFKSYSRNNDWKTDFNLFSTDIEHYPNSTHLLFYMGNHLSGSERSEILTNQLQKENFTSQQIKDSTTKENFKAIQYLGKALSIYPALPSDGYNQMGKAFYNVGQIDSAQKYYMKAFKEDSTNAIFINNLGTVFYIKNQVMEAFPYFMLAHKRDTTESDFVNNIGCIYGATQRPDSAIYWFDKASKLDPMDITSLGFLEITYRAVGKIKEADYYKNKLAEVKSMRADANQ